LIKLKKDLKIAEEEEIIDFIRKYNLISLISKQSDETDRTLIDVAFDYNLENFISFLVVKYPEYIKF